MQMVVCIALGALVFSSPALAKPASSGVPIWAVASWYDPTESGNAMANGQLYRLVNSHRLEDPRNARTVAATKHFPLGACLELTNVENQRTTFAEVTDRGGFEKYGRKIDMNEVVAMDLDVIYTENGKRIDKGVANLLVRQVPEAHC